MVLVTVRWFAAAAAAAGCPQEQVVLDGPATLADLVRLLGGRDPVRLAPVLGVCSFLVDAAPTGTRELARVALVDGATVDVLPPFAGG